MNYEGRQSDTSHRLLLLINNFILIITRPTASEIFLKDLFFPTLQKEAMISDCNHFIVTYFEFTGAQGDVRPEVAADRLSMTQYN